MKMLISLICLIHSSAFASDSYSSLLARFSSSTAVPKVSDFNAHKDLLGLNDKIFENTSECTGFDENGTKISTNAFAFLKDGGISIAVGSITVNSTYLEWAFHPTFLSQDVIEYVRIPPIGTEDNRDDARAIYVNSRHGGEIHFRKNDR